MAESFKIPAIGIVYSEVAPENTNVWWMDKSVLSSSVYEKLKVYNEDAKSWVLYYSWDNKFIPLSQKGVASGVATLDSAGLVPKKQLGVGTASSFTYLRGDGTWQPASGMPFVFDLNGQTGGSQSFARVNDTNVTISINSAANIHTWTMGWTGLLSPARGGTGVNNGSSTITLAANFAIAGFPITLTATGSTNVTLPTAGTLATTGDLSSYVPTSRTLSINGVSYDLSANRSWTVDTLPSQTGNNGKWLTTNGTIASWSALSGNVSLFTNDAGYITSAALTGYVPTSRQLTINGVTYDLSADRTWTIPTGTGTVTSVSAGTGMNFTTITGAGSVAIDTTKVPYYSGGFSTGLAKWDGMAWVFDSSTYLTTISGLNISLLTNDSGYITSAALSGYLKADGTVPLTANWNVGAYEITANKFIGNNGFGFNVGLGGTLVSASTTVGAKTWTLPDNTGTIALTSDIPSLSGYVPYTGATTNVNLGANTISGGGGTMSGAFNVNIAALKFFRVGATALVTMQSDLSNASLISADSTTTTGSTDIKVSSGTQTAYLRTYGTATAGNYPSSSVAASSSAGVIVTVGGSTSYLIGKANSLYWLPNSGYGFRYDTNGLRVGVVADLHTANTSTNDIANFYKNQNGFTALRVANNTSGTAGSAAIAVSSDNFSSTSSYFGAFSAGYTTSGIAVASTAVVAAGTVAGMNLGTTGATQLSFWTNNTERGRFLSTGEWVVGKTALTASADIANYYKNQNGYTSVRLINNTSGTSGAAGYSVTANDFTSGLYMNAYSAGYTTNGVQEAGAMAIWTNSTGGLNIGTNAAYQMSFWTNNVKRASIDSNGNNIFTVGALATNATNGFIYIPSCAGTPTGVPTAVTGGVPLVADSTNNKIYAYVGGAWTALN